MKAIFVYLSGSKRGKTEFFTDKQISIGTDPSCNARFEPSLDRNTSPLHAEIHFEKCTYILKDLDSTEGTFVNNRLIKEVVLQDSDLIEFGDNGPRVRFRIKAEEGDVCKPFREMLADSMDLARETHKGRRLTTATLFFKTLLYEAYTQSSLQFKVLSFIIFVIIFGGVVALSHTIYTTLAETTKRIEVLELKSTVAEKIIRNFSGGVCLIQCSFSLIDELTGEPLKSWSDGSLLTNDYTGTGFLVSKDGMVLTNHHIAEPWWGKSAQFVSIRKGFKPRFEVFRAFFPNVKEPFPLKIERVSEEADVALLSFDPRGIAIPVLELDAGQIEAIEGEPVVLIGYPAGLSALFAKTDPDLAREISQLPFIQAAQELSDRALIRPITTQGHISDVLKERIIYDAQTTVGGSGGPLFNNKGRVVAVNYGIFRGFGGANFGVPIKHALVLIEEGRRE
ncbi:MAG: trypsin-like peptidase domain-containing protein [Candidatus Scalindua sp.]|nr:trypsin-like peptidase domain-containing protein [Candidatus Scalindua sp.]